METEVTAVETLTTSTTDELTKRPRVYADGEYNH